jgi:hypothetical protein
MGTSAALFAGGAAIEAAGRTGFDRFDDYMGVIVADGTL